MSALSVVQKRFPQVKTVIDSKKSVEIEVNSTDVDKAKRKDKKGCAMAIACKRKFHLDGIIVSLNRAYLIKGTKATRFTVPEAVSREIISFDRGSEFQQGQYKIKKIPDREIIGSRLNRKRGKHTGKGRKRYTTHRTKGVRAILGSKVDA